MLREALLSFCHSEGAPPWHASASERRDWICDQVRVPLAARLDELSERRSFLNGYAIDVYMACRNPRSIRIRDRRFNKLGPLEVMVRYVFEPEGTGLYLGLFLGGSTDSRLNLVNGHTMRDEVLLMAMASYFLPPGFDGKYGETPKHWEGFSSSCVSGNYKNRALIVRSYDRTSLPSEVELLYDLEQVTFLMQRIAVGEARSLVRSMGLEFHHDQSILSISSTIAGQSHSHRFPVFFGTNRERAGNLTDALNEPDPYTSERSSSLTYGICYVNIPKSHKFGSIGSSWWRRLLTGDDTLTLESTDVVASGDEFERRVKEHIASSPQRSRHILVYIHGYNVSFKEAAIRAAQLGVDLNVPTTAFFSWPSAASFEGYMADSAAIDASEPFLEQFLSTLSAAVGDAHMHFLVHSMGNRALLRIVSRLVNNSLAGKLRIGQILLAAPDVDTEVFRALAPAYSEVADRTTLYVCANDKALLASEWVHNFGRAGLCPPPTIVSGIDTVEVSELDLTLLGHGYYAQAHGVLHDMFTLITQGLSPDARQRLRPATTTEGGRYWVMVG